MFALLQVLYSQSAASHITLLLLPFHAINKIILTEVLTLSSVIYNTMFHCVVTYCINSLYFSFFIVYHRYVEYNYIKRDKKPKLIVCLFCFFIFNHRSRTSKYSQVAENNRITFE